MADVRAWRVTPAEPTRNSSQCSPHPRSQSETGPLHAASECMGRRWRGSGSALQNKVSRGPGKAQRSVTLAPLLRLRRPTHQLRGMHGGVVSQVREAQLLNTRSAQKPTCHCDAASAVRELREDHSTQASTPSPMTIGAATSSVQKHYIMTL